jgi:tetratricopeptide (TPR) repeat protein
MDPVTIDPNSRDRGPKKPLDAPAYSRFVELAETRRFADAEALAFAQLDKHAADWAFWKTQLGYVCFLNEEDAEAHFDRAPDHFDTLAARCPHDPNARFWKAYVELIVHDGHDGAREELQALLQMEPNHPYASLVMGGIPGEESKAIQHLQAALRVVPNNFRALRDLGRRFDQMGRRDEAHQVFKAMVDNQPFIENRYGVMNLYTNGVLTGAAHADAWKAEARRYLLPPRRSEV